MSNDLEPKIDIQICLGSSCFSRGNRNLVKVVENYLNENNLRHLVFFHGAHCFGRCEKGPLIKLNGNEYLELSEEKIISILDGIFGKGNISV